MGMLNDKVKNDIRKIVVMLKNMKVRDVLAYWIEGEIKGAEMYYHLYKISKDFSLSKQISKLFFELYKDELDHADELLAIYRELFPKEDMSAVELPSLEVIISRDVLMNLLKNEKFSEVFEILLTTEEFAKEIYEYLAKSVSDDKLKETFKWLAEIEQGHYDKLNKWYAKF